MTYNTLIVAIKNSLLTASSTIQTPYEMMDYVAKSPGVVFAIIDLIGVIGIKQCYEVIEREVYNFKSSSIVVID